MSVLSLYIPIISSNISEQYIKKMFKSHNIGQILKVDFVKNIEKNRREAFIHFDEWFENDESKKLKEDIQNPDTKTRFKYTDSGKYWPLLVNKNAHTRINNPKYEMLSSEDVNTEYKVSLNIKSNSYNSNSSLENPVPQLKIISKKQKQETYASKTALNIESLPLTHPVEAV